jgi:hypothetical protein
MLVQRQGWKRTLCVGMQADGQTTRVVRSKIYTPQNSKGSIDSIGDAWGQGSPGVQVSKRAKSYPLGLLGIVRSCPDIVLNLTWPSFPPSQRISHILNIHLLSLSIAVASTLKASSSCTLASDGGVEPRQVSYTMT